MDLSDRRTEKLFPTVRCYLQVLDFLTEQNHLCVFFFSAPYGTEISSPVVTDQSGRSARTGSKTELQRSRSLKSSLRSKESLSNSWHRTDVDLNPG